MAVVLGSSIAAAQQAQDAAAENDATAAEDAAADATPATENGDDEVLAAAREQARALFTKGIDLYHDGRYKDAIDEFLLAHRIYPNPVLSFNAALAYEKMGDSAGALRFYREYLRQDPSAGDRAEVERQIALHERKLQDKGLQQVTILSTPEGATVRIDERPVGVTPWTGELNPGRHRLRLRLEGYDDAEQRFELLAHRSLDVTVALTERTAAPPPPAAAPPPPDAPAASPTPPSTPPIDNRPRIRPLTYVTLGVGVATLGVAGAFEGLRQSSENDVREESTQLARHDAYDQMESRQTTARILLGVGSAATAAGGVLLAFDLTRDRSAKAATLGCGWQSCTIRGRF